MLISHHWISSVYSTAKFMSLHVYFHKKEHILSQIKSGFFILIQNFFYLCKVNFLI